MDTNHRDRVAFARVTSGVFERGSVVTHAQTGRPFPTKYAQAIFGRERSVIDTAYPGDIIGLVNALVLTPGDTLYLDEPVQFPPIATFAPEHFAVATAADSGKFKQFRKGIDQLDGEGVVQVLRSDLRGNQSPVLAAVGPMQFEVAQARMETEFGAAIRLERLGYTQARRTDTRSAAELDRMRGLEVLSRTDGHPAGAGPGQVADQHRRARPPRADPRAVAGRRGLSRISPASGRCHRPPRAARWPGHRRPLGSCSTGAGSASRRGGRMPGLQGHPLRTAVARALTLLLLVSGLVLAEWPAAMADGPQLTASKSGSGSALVGGTATYTLTATNPAQTGAVPEFNISFSDELPAGATFVPGSVTPADIGDPQVSTGPDGRQTLTWPDVADVAPGNSVSVTFTVRLDPDVYAVGDTVSNTGAVYGNTDPSVAPQFDADGNPVPATYTESATTGPAVTTITALRVTKPVPVAEGELLRRACTTTRPSTRSACWETSSPAPTTRPWSTTYPRAWSSSAAAGSTTAPAPSTPARGDSPGHRR